MNGPVRTPRCIACGCAISDDGPEQSDAWLASMCLECFEASELSLREWESNNADRTLEHETLQARTKPTNWSRKRLTR